MAIVILDLPDLDPNEAWSLTSDMLNEYVTARQPLHVYVAQRYAHMDDSFRESKLAKVSRFTEAVRESTRVTINEDPDLEELTQVLEDTFDSGKLQEYVRKMM